MSGTRAPKTIVVYDITGQTDYTIPFEYLARKFVVVTLIGQDRKVLTLNTDYRFTTKTTIGLSNTTPAGYDKIEIRRLTSATDRLVDFHDGSILRAYDLNLSQIQTLHVAEEARDLAGDSITVNDNGDLDARGRKIVNLGDAENDEDAVNLGQLKKFDDSTFNNAQLAKASADVAKVSANIAKASENRAVIAETRAVASAGTAVQAAMDANASKEAAEDAEQIVVPLVPIVEKASQDASKAAADAAQAVQDVKDLGAVPIGTIVTFVKALPAGYLACDGSTFSQSEYPDLYTYLGTNVLPDILDNNDMVIYAIKAAGKVSDEGLMEVTQIKEKIDAMTGSECQFPPMPTGVTPSDYHVAKDGSLLKRSEYPYLFQWANSKGLMVTEAKWQQLKAASHGGAVAVYSAGDGSTTFRVPSIGTYGMVQRPTPNGLDIDGSHFIGYPDNNKAHTHTRGTMEIVGTTVVRKVPNINTNTGAFSGSFQSGSIGGGTGDSSILTDGTLTFMASKAWTGATSSDGGSETTMKYMWCSIWIYAGVKVVQ